MHDHQISQSPLHPLPPQSAHPCRLSSLCRTYQANKICHSRINNNRNTFFSNLKKEKMLSQPCFQSFMKDAHGWDQENILQPHFFIFTLYFHILGNMGSIFFFYLHSLFSHSGEYRVNKGKKKLSWIIQGKV